MYQVLTPGSMNTARDQENMDGRENGYQFKPAFMIFQCT
jgi:hypothetical protein